MAAGDTIYSPKAQVTVITGAATRAAGEFSASGECAAISSNAYTHGDASLSCSFAIAPTLGGEVHLYRRDLNIDGADDATIPKSGYEHTFLGSFPVNDETTQQFIPLKGIALASGDQQFYIENDADQTMDSDYLVKITPMPLNTQ